MPQEDRPFKGRDKRQPFGDPLPNLEQAVINTYLDSFAEGVGLGESGQSTMAGLRECERTSQFLHQLALSGLKDPLTQRWNRRFFEIFLRVARELSDEATNFYVFATDLVGFGKANERLGAHFCDHLLSYLAQEQAASLRRGDDLVFSSLRYGGDELLFIVRSRRDLTPEILHTIGLRIQLSVQAVRSGEGFGRLIAGQEHLLKAGPEDTMDALEELDVRVCPRWVESVDQLGKASKDAVDRLTELKGKDGEIDM